MNHQQWLDWRRDGIGSSDAAIIMGVSPWKTPLELWQEKLFGNSDTVENSSMTRGKNLEEPARQAFEKALNTIVFPKNVVNTLHTWQRASLDGIDLDEKILVEIKCPNKEDHFHALMKKVPDKYFPQCQHQLSVTGLDGMYYFSFDGKEGTIVEVERDQKYIDELFLKEKEFWDMVLNQTPPPMTDRDYLCMEENPEWNAISEKWKETKKLLMEAEKDEQKLREQLIALSKDRSSQGNNIKLSKTICKGNIDYSLAIQDYLDNMRAHYPDIHFPDIALEPYRKKSFTKWTPRIIFENE
jgi:putative phage-type endonuclease